MANILESEFDKRHPDLALLRGHTKELNILQLYMRMGKATPIEVAPRFRQLIEQNPEWLPLFEHYGSSPAHFSRLMVTMYADVFFDHSQIYRVTDSLNIGESSMRVNRSIVPPIPLDFGNTESRLATDIQNISSDFEISVRMADFTRNGPALLEELERLSSEAATDFQRASYQSALTFFRAMNELSIPGFNPDFKPRPYQARAILRGLNNGVPDRTALGLFHGTRTGKTFTASARMRYLGSDKILHLVPARLKNLWAQEIRKYNIATPGILVIDSNPTDSTLVKAEDPEIQHIILGYELLARRFNSEKGETETEKGLLEELRDLHFNGLIADEVHAASGYRNGTATSEVFRILTQMPSIKHLILATATPADRVHDIDLLVHLLDPTTYPSPVGFSDQLRGNPRLAHNALLPLIDRVRTEDVLDKLPEFTEETLPINLTPTQRALYDFILRDESQHPFKKLTNLRAVITHTGLVKKNDFSVPFDQHQSIVELSSAFMRWKKETEKKPETIFDSDFLVTHGFTNLYLSAFFNLKGGISELVTNSHAEMIIDAWKGEPISAKFVAIRDKIKEKLARGEKVIVASGMFTQGITKGVIDDETEQEAFESLMGYLQKEFGEETILKIDSDDDTKLTVQEGDHMISERELIRRGWQHDTNYKILLIHARSSGQGTDLSIQDPAITGVSMILESLPYSHRIITQLKARIMSDTQLSPVTYIFADAENTLDEDIHWLLDRKSIPIGMLLDGVALTEEELQILDNNLESETGAFARSNRSPRQNLALIFKQMTGRSAVQNREFLSKEFRKNETYEQYMAENYDELYLDGYSGNAIKLVKTVVENLINRGLIDKNKIADWGSGPLVLSRMLGYPVLSLDMSSLMLEEGKRKLEEMGIPVPSKQLIAGSLEDLPEEVFPKNSVSAGVCALALDCTFRGESRAEAVKRMGNSIEEGGYLIITVPQTEMDAEDYQKFMLEFTNLGFSDDLSLSGLVKGMNNQRTVFNCWLFVLKKTHEAGNINPDNLLFTFEKSKSTRSRKTETRVQSMIQYRSQRTPEAENFIVCQPIQSKSSDKWPEIGELNDLSTDSLTRYALDLSDGTLAYYGYRREVVFRNGKQEINLTRN